MLWRFRLRGAVVGTTAAAVTLLGACSVTPVAENASETTEGPSATTTVAIRRSPTEQRIAELAGPDVVAVYEAVDEARFDFIVSCMRKDGWDFDRSMLPDVFEPAQADSDLMGTSADNAIRMIESLEGWRPEQQSESGSQTTVPTQGTAEEQTSAVSECFDRSLAEIPNPIEPFQRWLEGEQSALSDLVNADERIVEAHIAEDRCFSESGYDFRDSGDVGDYFDTLVEPIKEAYSSGDLEASDAIEQLRPIADEGREINDVLEHCLRERLATAGEVRSEYELAWLDENADRVALAAAELLGDLEGLRDYLPEPPP